jgi:galactokinase
VAALRDVPDLAALAPLDDGTAEGALLLRRARHIVTENARVLEVVAILRGDDGPAAIGPVLTAGHASLRDDFEISTVELDTAVATALEAGAAGARMVGGGFGGSAIVLVDAVRTAATVTSITDRFAVEGYRAPRTFAVTPAPGAHRLV